jgi:hypothetical protein
MHFKIKDSELTDKTPLPKDMWAEIPPRIQFSPTFIAVDIYFIISGLVIIAVQLLCVAVALRDMVNDRFNLATQLTCCLNFLLILGGLIFIHRYFWDVRRPIFKHPIDSPPNS